MRSDEKVQARDTWMKLWEWSRGVKIFLLHVTIHERASTLEEAPCGQNDSDAMMPTSLCHLATLMLAQMDVLGPE